ncbi:unnamed protein product [Rotaria magnacalcarata]|uniref:Uncharacterized protein n=1 Tax=Rotaria magnacalcarata TaxID=392030 RepID=A0A8S3JB39_9BILA|nr:unnamed protein product [Rotaria magnacalcarata]CAF5216591.1 unnamed protein product [Rotaria magnacalcarata]
MLSNYEENNTSAIIEPLARGVSAIRLDLGSSEASPLPSNRQSEQTEVNLRSPSENGNSSVIPKATNAKDSNSNTVSYLFLQRTSTEHTETIVALLYVIFLIKDKDKENHARRWNSIACLIRCLATSNLSEILQKCLLVKNRQT